MFAEFFNFDGYGIFVWPAFFFTFVSCFALYLVTKKEFKKHENIFIKNFQQAQAIKIKIDKRKKTEIKEEALSGNSI